MRPARRGPLALAGGIVALGLFFLVGAFWVRGEAAYAGVGPRAFPIAIGGGLALLGLVFVAQLRRGVAMTGEAGEDVDASRAADWPAFGWVLGGLVLAVPLIERAGFPLTAALVFVLTARGFGSRRLVRDSVLGLLVGGVTYVLFARWLGVSLPGGPFG